MFAAQKNCKINLSSLFASPRQAKMSQSCSSLLVKPHVSTTHKVENGVDKEMGGEKTKKRSSRETKVPSKLSDYVCKVSGTCPRCKTYVESEGVICKSCQAYWHYGCANVTQEILDNEWKGDFVCEQHRKSLTGIQSTAAEAGCCVDVFVAQDNEEDNGEVLRRNIKINPYSLNKLSQIKKTIYDEGEFSDVSDSGGKSTGFCGT